MAKAATSKGNKNNMTEATATPTKLTLAQKIANTEALLAKYRALENSLAQINNVEVGDNVTIKFGRGDKARTESGVILAVGDTAQGRMVSVSVGEGIDISVRKVRAADIVSNSTADARNAEAAPGSDESDEDPLAAA